RSHNIANIYIDHELRQSFRTDSLGGIGDNDVFLGNMVWYEQGADDANVRREDNAFTGNLDEICLFAQALPPTLIERYSVKSPGGKENGLITYLSFCHQERNKENDIVLTPNVYNQVVKKDMDGNEIAAHDSVFVDPINTVMQFVDNEMGAPVQPYQELSNLDFSFVGRDNQLMISLNEQDSRINKRNFYITVTDIPDMNGNYMASPATMAFYVDRNPLRWQTRTIHEQMAQGLYEFENTIVNNSGASHQFELKGLPKWLTVDIPMGIIDPKGEVRVTFTVDEGLNVGSYDEIIYVVDENGLCEPMTLNVTVQGETPDWSVPYELRQYSMNIVGRVLINNVIVTDSRDLVGVFDATGRCMGVNNVSYNPETAESKVYLTVYDSTTVKTPLNFKLWHYQTGKTMMLQPSEQLTFVPGLVVGTVKAPVIFTAGDQYIQKLSLRKGWNWISLNVYNNDFRDINNLLKRFPWQDGDILTDDSQGLTLIYKKGQWVSNKDDVVSSTTISPAKTYRINVKNDIDIELTGTSLEQESMRTITVKNGWNSIGYTPMINLDVETALADYDNYASDGDVIKCQDGFSMYTTDLYGTGEWAGSLRYMIPGKGYMLKRLGKETVKFKYNYYDPNSSFFAGSQKASRRVNPHLYPTTMSLAATITGVTPEAGDRLLAVCQGEVRGEADYDGDEVLYMSISGSDNAPLFFVLERGDDWIAATSELLRYESNGVSGSPMQPTEIKFVSLDDQQYGDGWYTLQGVKLDKKPLQRGVYIFNGKKIVVK
ncbi:MAG: hypothetical protein J6Z41_04815, partial [Prevotella sp.]|nr:hypothetical protein [Prevotella sp.]